MTSMNTITQQLDFTIKSTEERLSLLHRILEEPSTKHYLENWSSRHLNVNLKQSSRLSDSNSVCKNLEYLAGYILYNKEESLKDTGIIREKTQRYRDTKQVSLDKINDCGEKDIENSTYYVSERPRVEKRDLERFSVLRFYQEYIDAIQLEIADTENARERYQGKKKIKQARQDMLSIKIELSKPIKSSKVYTFYGHYPFLESTGDIMSSQKGLAANDYQCKIDTLDFSNPTHILHLLKMYSQLKATCYGDFQSSLYYVLLSLEDVIDKAKIDPYLLYILEKRIDNHTFSSIAHQLKMDTGLSLSASYLAFLFGKKIPEIIAATYRREYERWFFSKNSNSEIDFKRCNRCHKMWLRSSRYYRRDKKSQDGLSSICKECRNLADKRRREKSQD